MKNDLAAMDDSSDNPDRLLAKISSKGIWNRRCRKMHADNLFVCILFICDLIFQILIAIYTKNYVSAASAQKIQNQV